MFGAAVVADEDVGEGRGLEVGGAREGCFGKQSKEEGNGGRGIIRVVGLIGANGLFLR